MKKISMLLAISLMAFTLLAFSTGIKTLTAKASESDIMVNGRKITYQMPVVDIDGVTYVPLRETAEKYDMSVEWDGENNSVYLKSTEDLANQFDLYHVVTALFDCVLPVRMDENPKSAMRFDILQGDAIPELCVRFEVKGFDIATVYDKIIDKGYIEKSTSERLIALGEKYDWWDLTEISENDILFFRLEKGVDKTPVEMEILISPRSDGTTCFYLYYM